MRLSYNRKQIFIALLAIAISCIVMYELIDLLLKGRVATVWVLPIIGMIIFVGLFIPFAKEYLDGFRIGEDGEQFVERLLAHNLPATYVCLHDLTLPGNKGNIDEAVISPYGIWTLEVKNSSVGGEITFQNELLYKNHYPLEGKGLKQAYAEAKHLEEFIKESLGLAVPVHPVLVFANTKV